MQNQTLNYLHLPYLCGWTKGINDELREIRGIRRRTAQSEWGKHLLWLLLKGDSSVKQVVREWGRHILVLQRDGSLKRLYRYGQEEEVLVELLTVGVERMLRVLHAFGTRVFPLLRKWGRGLVPSKQRVHRVVYEKHLLELGLFVAAIMLGDLDIVGNDQLSGDWNAELALEYNDIVNGNVHEQDEDVRSQVAKRQECVVCTDVCDMRRVHLTVACQHERNVCDECMARYIAAVVERGTTDNISCPVPDCNGALHHEEVRRLSTSSVFKRYDYHRTRRCIEEDSNFRWCANPRCGNGLLAADGANTSYVRCEMCGTKTCFRHRVVWHEGMTCAEYDAEPTHKEKLSKQEAKTLEVLRKYAGCPKCTQKISKRSGCDHMTCRCGHEFCYRCLAPYNGPDGIFRRGNKAHRRSCRYYCR